MKNYSEKEKQDMRLVLALTKGAKALRKRESEKILAAGVTFPQFEVLVAVYHYDRMTVNQIIGKTLSTIGNISLVISNLVKDGYLASEADEKDKRSKIITLSEKGRKFMDDFFPEHMANLADIFSVYNDEEKAQLLELLSRLRK